MASVQEKLAESLSVLFFSNDKDKLYVEVKDMRAVLK